MEVLINSKSEVDHEMEIIVPSDELKPHFDKAYRDEAKTITVPGFRRGKAPLQIIKRRFGEAIEYQTIDKISNDFFRQSIEERDIKPISQPVLVDMDYTPGGDLTIKVSYETMPDVVAKDYTGIQLEKLVHETTDEELEDELQALRKQRRTLEDTEKAEEEGYVVTFDLEILDEEGNPVPGKKSTDIKVDIDDETLHTQLRAELLNLKAGEEAEIELNFEKEDGTEGTERAYLTLHRVQKATLPEIDDEFAKSVSGGMVERAGEFKGWLKERIMEHWENRYGRMLEDDLIRKIIDRNKVDVPDSIAVNIIDDYVQHLRDNQPDRKLPKSFDEAKYREERRPQAEFTANWMFVRESIIEQEGIKLDDGDVEKKAEVEAERIGIKKEQLMEFYKHSDEISASIVTDKLIKFLLESAKIKEVDDNDISNTSFEALQHNHGHHHHNHGHDHDHDHEHDHDHDHDHVHDHDDEETDTDSEDSK